MASFGGAFKAANGGLKSVGYLGAGMTALDFKANMDQGQGVGEAAMKSLTTYAAWSAAAPVMWAHTAATTGVDAVEGAYKWRKQRSEEMRQQLTPDRSVGGNYMDTSRAQTMRQAAVQAIQGSKMNARSSLGGEARLFHNNTPRQW